MRLTPDTLAIVVLSAWGMGMAVQESRAAEWPQWGGAARNFTAQSEKLADRWPAEGPPVRWRRSLGEGYSAIVGDGDRIYTMYREELAAEEEIVIAIDARRGTTVWEKRFASKPMGNVTDHGRGPNSTPLIAGNRLFAIGTNAVVRCLDKLTGNLIWERDLHAEFSSPDFGDHGYSISPVAYKDMLIIPLGYRRDAQESNSSADGAVMDGRCRSVIALRLADGQLAWKGNEYLVHQSSPTVITHAGQDQLVLLMCDGVAGIDPATGRELWRLGFEQSALYNITPLWDEHDTLVFASDGGPGGGRAVRLVRESGNTAPRELWTNPKMATFIYMGVHIDGAIYLPGSSGRFYSYDVKTGRRLWVERGFKSASCVLADGKVFILDGDGQLTLATATKTKLEVHAQCQVAERLSITCPTIIGRTLFIRDRKHVMALDVGEPGAANP